MTTLPENWEAVEAEDGRTYFWNVETDETSWDIPTVTTATRDVAAGYLAKVLYYGIRRVWG